MSQADRSTGAPTASTPGGTKTKILLVDAPDEDAAEQHSAVLPWRLKGWNIRRTAPRVVEQEGAQLLVVLERDIDQRA